MKMRDLEIQTGVNRETIRVYFRHGLLPEPSRPKPNVADYTEAHVAAVRAVRDLQIRSGLTLPQIHDAMNGKAPPRQIDAGAFQNLETLLAMRVDYDSAGLVALSKLQEQNPHAEKDARVFAALDIVTLIEGEKGPMLSLSDSRLVQIWAQMREVGFTEERGFTADILSYYRDAAEHVSSHEARLFRERVGGRIDENEAVDMLEHALTLMLEFFSLLRLKLFLSKIGPNPSAPR